MSLVILGQSGGPTQLSANDDVFGLMTQVPTGAVKHDEAGLTNADGSTAFGQEFSLIGYATKSTTVAEQTTTITLASDDLPYKVRVLGVKVRCISNRPAEFQDGYGYVRVLVEDGDGDSTWSLIASAENVGDMVEGEVRELEDLDHSTAVIDADEGLRVKVTVKADSSGINPTVAFMVELRCMRVI